MCIVIDTNTLPSVFDRTSGKHTDFKPILDWVLEGKGMFIYGGTKYLKELGHGKFLRLFVELTKVKKAKKVDCSLVDEKAAWAASTIQSQDFDDEHLIGLLLVSGCKLICSLDERAYDFFRHPAFFKPATKRPKIYNQKSNADLLIDANMADICKKNANKLTVEQKENLLIQKKN